MPSLVFTNGPRVGERFALNGERGAAIGRSEDSDILLADDHKVSAEHARLRLVEECWWAVDLGSSNGTRVNGGLAASPVALADGDVLAIGDSLLEFVEGREPVEAASDDAALAAELAEAYARMREEIGRVVVGQEEVVEQVLIAIFCRGHALLTGVPGLAKTLLVSTLSEVLDLDYKRVQFTPDLMPADITGTEVLDGDPASGSRAFRFVKGPLFANMVLADEINRTPPKTQAALLEAMQEHHITAGDRTHPLPEPFFVLATQNPIEQEGTYPLPEAQLDRFLFNIVVGYPSAEDEQRIIQQATAEAPPTVGAALDGAAVLRLQGLVRRVPAADHVVAFAAALARASRPGGADAPDFVGELVSWGAGPRAGINLVSAAKARAVLRGRNHATTGDVAAVAAPVLRHRIITTFKAEAAGTSSDDVVRMLLEHVAAQTRAEL